MHTLATLVRKTARRLEAAGVGDARLEADLIWTTALGVDRAALYAAFSEAPPPDADSPPTPTTSRCRSRKRCRRAGMAGIQEEARAAAPCHPQMRYTPTRYASQASHRIP